MEVEILPGSIFGDMQQRLIWMNLNSASIFCHCYTSFIQWWQQTFRKPLLLHSKHL